MSPKSSAVELSALREEVLARDNYSCVWPGCDYKPAGWQTANHLQLAHLTHRGMGGSKERNTPENCVTLCSVHHDCLDGRTGLGTLRLELNSMLRAARAWVDLYEECPYLDVEGLAVAVYSAGSRTHAIEILTRALQGEK